MADIKIVNRSFVNDNGDVVNFKRLLISGVVQGEVQTVELRVNKTEAMLVDMLLKSNESEVKVTTSHQPYVSNKANDRLVEEAEKALKEEEESKEKEEFQQGFSL